MTSAHDATSLLEIAMVAARDLPPEMQGEMTRLILAYASDECSMSFASDEAATGDGATSDDPRDVDAG